MQATQTPPDWRHVTHGRRIPTEFYSDQPYVVQTADGAWLCTLTTGAGHEGTRGQHVISLRSTDHGHTWSAPVDVESAHGPEASYAVLFRTDFGRIYCFYNYNADNQRTVNTEDGGSLERVDSLGQYVFKYTDDHGRSWSPVRHAIPVREFQCDRENVYGGKVRFFWNVGRPFKRGTDTYFSLHKVGAMGKGFFAQSEGVLLKCVNIRNERDPAKLKWETLPDGDVGLRTPAGGGRIAEEQSYSVLSDGSIYCVYRSIDGHPVNAYSRDGGHTWTAPAYKRYADGRLMKHPRAANFAWRYENGKWLYWFHNHGGRFVPLLDPEGYQGRNPVWLCAGVEIDTPTGRELAWSQPEIAIYDDDPLIRMSYPDLIEEDGKLFLTETNKERARVHEIDRGFLERLWGQFECRTVAQEGLLFEHTVSAHGKRRIRIAGPALPSFGDRDWTRADYGTKDRRAGFTLELWLQVRQWSANQELLSSRTADGRGIVVRTTAPRTIELSLSDGTTNCTWESDAELFKDGSRHHVVMVIDGGPRIISFIVDGQFCDGAAKRPYGWGRFSPNLMNVNGEKQWRIGRGVKVEVELLRVYGRALMTSEAVGNFRAGCNAIQSGG